MTVYTIDEWLRGKVDYDIPDKTLQAIKYDRGVIEDGDMSRIDTKTKELCYADLLIWLSTSSSVTTGEYESDGGWQHQHSNKNVVDKNELKDIALRIYTKYGEVPEYAPKAKKLVFKNL